MRHKKTSEIHAPVEFHRKEHGVLTDKYGSLFCSAKIKHVFIHKGCPI
jgi:hypothetical protein